MGPVRQNRIQRTVRSVHMCVHCAVIIFPLTLQTITIAPMMSIEGRGMGRKHHMGGPDLSLEGEILVDRGAHCKV